MAEGALDTEEVERRASAVLASVPDWIWDGEALPVPVEDIVDSCFGLLVRDVEDMSAAPGAPEPGPAEISGLLLTGRGEIWVNAAEAREWPARRRFTIGHELGHWVMHRAGQGSLFCRHASVAEPEEATTKPALPVPEEEANYFAAALLMPQHLIRDHYEDCGGDFSEMCRRFSSSGAAMGRRLHQAVPRSR